MTTLVTTVEPACKGQGSLFTEGRLGGKQVAEAAELCKTCPVFRECEEYAEEHYVTVNPSRSGLYQACVLAGVKRWDKRIFENEECQRGNNREEEWGSGSAEW